MGDRVRKIVTGLLEMDVRLHELEFHPEMTISDKRRRKDFDKQMKSKERMHRRQQETSVLMSEPLGKPIATGGAPPVCVNQHSDANPDTLSTCSTLVEGKV